MATHKTPSRIRYEKANPVIAIRVNHETKERLELLSIRSGKSLGSLIRENLDVQEASIGEAYKNGYKEAKMRYCVTFACSVCGSKIECDTPDAKQVISKRLTAAGWRHTKC